MNLHVHRVEQPYLQGVTRNSACLLLTDTQLHLPVFFRAEPWEASTHHIQSVSVLSLIEQFIHRSC